MKLHATGQVATSSEAGNTVRSGSAPREAVPPGTEVLRFQRLEIRLHWAIAIPFVLCYLSALILVVVYNPSPLRPYRGVFTWLHRISGVCLALIPAWAVLRYPRSWKVHLANVRECWIWTWNDLCWLLRMGLSVFSRKVDLPKQGKFNAGEKLNFMMVMTTCPLFILTGILIWMPGAAFLSWLAHFSLAVLVTPIFLGHIFMATVNPDTRPGLRGMISGFVNRRWARHHYRLWYDENYAQKNSDVTSTSQPAQSSAPDSRNHSTMPGGSGKQS